MVFKFFKKLRNLENLTKLHLSQAIQKGYAQVGDHSYGKVKIRFQEGGSLSIGKYCSFADQIEVFLGGNHRSDFVSTYPFHAFVRFNKNADITDNKVSKGNVVIGNDVWIGSNVRILSGVKIGNGAIIGTGSIVVSDVPDYAIYAGNPARNIRFRFNQEIITELLRLKWWDLQEEKIVELAPLLSSSDIGRFLELLRALNGDNFKDD